MSAHEEWWERNLREQRELYEKHKNSTFEELIPTVDMTHDKQWNHPSTEDMFGLFNLYAPYDIGYEVEFLTIRPTAFTWICTDTNVGIYILFYINEDGSETPIGVRQQPARKSDADYALFTEEWIDIIRNRLLEMLKNSDNKPPIVSIDSRSTMIRY